MTGMKAVSGMLVDEEYTVFSIAIFVIFVIRHAECIAVLLFNRQTFAPLSCMVRHGALFQQANRAKLKSRRYTVFSYSRHGTDG
jgi:hypothetical protein